MESKAILRVDENSADLYVPEDIWKELIQQIDISNRLTVVLRMIHEYQGDLKLEEVK